MTTPAPHTPDAVLFDNLLSCEQVLPAAFFPATGPGRLPQAQSLLRALALVEDLGRDEHQSEHDELPPLGPRMEAKLDLALLLLGRVLEHTTSPLPTCRVRWSIRGARLHAAERPPAPPGTDGLLRIQPSDWLPEPLDLPARVLATTPVHLWLHFPTFPPGLADALERHLFRQHRRQIALARGG